MTEEIAFKLGKLDFPCFYQLVQWKVNKEPFPLAYFFRWSVPGGIGGWPLVYNEAKEHVTDWQNLTASGSLRTELIDSPALKLAYIRGRLDSYSVSIFSGSIRVGYANSYNLRDFLAQCFQDVLAEKFWYGKNMIESPKWTVSLGEDLGSIPGTPWVLLEGDLEVIEYIVGK